MLKEASVLCDRGHGMARVLANSIRWESLCATEHEQSMIIREELEIERESILPTVIIRKF